MKKIILILLAIIFTTSAYAHSTKDVANYDSKKECRKTKSLLNFISKHKLYKDKGGELIKFKSYTGFDQRTVIIGGDNMDVYMPQFINFFKENLL